MTDLSGLTAGAASYTGEYTFVGGEYALGDERVPYFSVAMRVTDAVGHLSLARDLIFDPAQPVRLEELFQRDLDTNRANDEIKEYLRQPNRIKFFNSFTVVLMPIESNDRPIPLTTYPLDDPAAPPAPHEDTMTLSQVGPIRIRRLTANADVGYLSWNVDRVKAVIIDGQHRFYALKQLYDDLAYRARLRPATTRIPVLVLVLDERAGFRGATGVPADVTRTCRTIFIDLNKNAESVSRTRQYLLDDRDIAAVAMRHIISQAMGAPVGDPTASDHPRIPLALVDWYSDQAKFDSGLHLSTIVVLYDIVSATIDRRAPDPTDYEAWVEYLGELHDRITSDDTQREWDLQPTLARLDEAEQAAEPFSLTEEEISHVAMRFAESLGQLIVRPLLELRPYADLATAYRAANLLGGSLELWLGHDDLGKAAFQRLTGQLPSTIANRIASEHKGKHSLAFQVVFQKAIIRAAVALDDARGDLVPQWSLPGAPTREEFLSTWCRRFDERIAPFLGNADFWRGTGIDISGTINWARPAIFGIAGLMVLCILCPFDELSVAPVGPQTELEKRVRAILTRGDDDESRPLLNDPLRAQRPIEELLVYSRWLIIQMSTSRQRRSTGLQAAIRAASTPYRQQVHKYLEAEARTSTTS